MEPSATTQPNSRLRSHLAASDGTQSRCASAHQLFESPGFTEYRNFALHVLQTEAASLIGNPLGDSTRRRHGVLVPKGVALESGWPVVFVLAGFTGNGPNYFNLKTFEANFSQTLDRAVERGEAPRAVYVFVEAMTYWGGSQFINSHATGRYEDFVLDDVVPAVRELLPVSRDSKKWCVMGGSSGGYGALHLSSVAPEIFGLAAAIAPDSFFEASLLPEFWLAAPTLNKLGGIQGVRDELESGKLQRRKDWHSILNAVAMALCYGATEVADRQMSGGIDPVGVIDNSGSRGAALFPINLQTGLVDEARFARLKAHDPIVFLARRAPAVLRLSGIFLDVGTRDQFHLQYGARQIRDVLKGMNAPLRYSEFEGNHFDISERRPQVWRWLMEQAEWVR